MVRPMDWMMHVDLYILDELEKSDIILSPRVVAAAIDYRRNYVAKRSREMIDAGLVRNVDEDELPGDVSERGMIVITDLGSRYLADELTDEEAERLEEFGDPPDDGEIE
jgi:hypothetical protein